MSGVKKLKCSVLAKIYIPIGSYFSRIQRRTILVFFAFTFLTFSKRNYNSPIYNIKMGTIALGLIKQYFMKFRDNENMLMVTQDIGRNIKILWKYISRPIPNLKKSRIRETKNLSTNADSRTDTILVRLQDLSAKKKKNK